MSSCGCGDVRTENADQRRALIIALGLNVTMFVVGTVAGVLGQSNGLIADALDMLADASAYAIALLALSRSTRFKVRAAMLSGTLLLSLGVGVLVDTARRAILGSSPQSLVMIVVAMASLAVNTYVLEMLAKQQNKKEVHLRATYIFTRVDIVANIAIIVSGVALLFTHFRYVDLIVGAGIGIYVIREAFGIFRETRDAGANVKQDS